MIGKGITTLFARTQALGMVSLLGLSASLALSQFIQSASYAQSARSASKSSLKLSGHINVNKYSGAESGVQLLDHIFNRVSNIPQVASIQNQVFTQTQQRLQNKDSVGKDGIDYKLAIRPKETGKPFANMTPSLQISADKSPLLAYDQGVQSNSRFQQSQSGAAAPAQQSQAAGFDSHAEDADSMERSVKLSKKTADVWKGNSKYVHPVSGSDDMYADESPKLGVWDREGTASQIANEVNAYNSLSMAQARRKVQQQAPARQELAYGASNSGYAPAKRMRSQSLAAGAGGSSAGSSAGALPPTNMGKFAHQTGDNSYLQRERAGGLPGGGSSNRLKQQGVNVYSAAAEAQSRMPELANSLNKFYNINKGLEDVQQFSDRLAQAPPPPSAPVPMSITTSAKKKTAFYNAPRELQILDERPQVRDFREAPRVAMADAAPSPSPSPVASPSPASKPSPSPVVSGSLMRRLDSGEAKRAQAGEKTERLKAKEEVAQKESNYKELEKESVSEKKRDLLALLPPNVATGIPLVSLGTSQMQAINALSAIGQVKEQKIGKWTVLTWKKKDSNFTALQLFFRHGLLDAMRIFDQSLIAPDFGAAPGANLEAVKARFGEPAFLLPEPNPGIGQNYVYPISQVGFQFARPEKDTAPQVVSVLIFSVK